LWAIFDEAVKGEVRELIYSSVPGQTSGSCTTMDTAPMSHGVPVYSLAVPNYNAW